MEHLTVRPPANTLIFLHVWDGNPVIVLEFCGKTLGFPVVQHIKYQIFRYQPFLERKYHLMIDLPSYCKVPDEGWRFILLLKRWLDYQSKKIFFRELNQDIMDWIVKFKQEKLFTFIDAGTEKTT